MGEGGVGSTSGRSGNKGLTSVITQAGNGKEEQGDRD